MEPHQVEWGEPTETVDTLGELDSLLDRLHARYIGENRIWASIDGPVGQLMIGLAYDRSVLSYIYPDNIPPYLVSDNGFKDRDEIDFYFCGHHSPVLAQNLIPMETARGAVRTFVEHRALALDVRWREV